VDGVSWPVLVLGLQAKAKAATRRYAGAYPKIQMIFPA